MLSYQYRDPHVKDKTVVSLTWESPYLEWRSSCSDRALGVVSLKFCELSKITSRNLCIAEVVLLMSNSSWNFIRVPQALLTAHVQRFSLKFSPQMWMLALYIFARLFWRARETLVKQSRGPQIWYKSSVGWKAWKTTNVTSRSRLRLLMAQFSKALGQLQAKW